MSEEPENPGKLIFFVAEGELQAFFEAINKAGQPERAPSLHIVGVQGRLPTNIDQQRGKQLRAISFWRRDGAPPLMLAWGENPVQITGALLHTLRSGGLKFDGDE